MNRGWTFVQKKLGENIAFRLFYLVQYIECRNERNITVSYYLPAHIHTTGKAWGVLIYFEVENSFIWRREQSAESRGDQLFTTKYSVWKILWVTEFAVFYEKIKVSQEHLGW